MVYGEDFLEYSDHPVQEQCNEIGRYHSIELNLLSQTYIG